MAVRTTAHDGDDDGLNYHEKHMIYDLKLETFSQLSVSDYNDNEANICTKSHFAIVIIMFVAAKRREIVSAK